MVMVGMRHKNVVNATGPGGVEARKALSALTIWICSSVQCYCNASYAEDVATCTYFA